MDALFNGNSKGNGAVSAPQQTAEQAVPASRSESADRGDSGAGEVKTEACRNK
jgi:hypothetical protein